MDTSHLAEQFAAMGFSGQQGSSQLPSKEELVTRHKQLKELLQHKAGEPMVMSRLQISRDVKPPEDFPVPPSLDDLTPIRCADLVVNTTHRGRMLRGRLIVDACCTGSVDTILEDEYGDAVRVAVYNSPVLAAEDQGFCVQSAAQHFLPKHQAVALKEPFFKLAADGMCAVRVDNPAEVVFLDSLDENLEGLLERGNKHFNAAQYTDATTCYDKALQLFLQDNQQRQRQPPAVGQLMLSALLNLSATHVKLQQPLQALLYASAAAALSCHKNSKAYYRAAMAVDCLLGLVLESASSGGGSSSSTSRGAGVHGTLQILKVPQLVAAAKALMQTSIQLSGPSTGAAKSQMLAALVNVAAAASKAPSTSSSKAGRSKSHKSHKSSTTGKDAAAAADDGGWGAVVSLLAAGAAELKSCFTAAAAAGSETGKSGDSSNMAAAAGGSASSSRGSSDASRRGSSDVSTTAVLTAADATGAKEAGNAAFTRADYATALQHYQAAFACLCHLDDVAGKRAARLLSNRASCGLQLSSQGTHQQAFVDALSCALLDPTSVQAFHRAATALMQLDRPNSAQAVLQLGMALLDSPKPLKELQRRLNTAAAAAQVTAGADQRPKQPANSPSKSQKHSAGKSNHSSSGGGSSTAGSPGNGASSTQEACLSERQYKQMVLDGTLTVEKLAQDNDQLTMAMRKAGKDSTGWTPLVDNRIPPFHEEFSKGGRCPPLVDVVWASVQLGQAYESARALPRHLMLAADPETVTYQVILQRLMSLDEERMRWLCSAEMGDVRFLPDWQLQAGYKGGWQSWANCTRPEFLTLGTTHVAVGFVDLGDLASSCELLLQVEPSLAAAAAGDATGEAAAPTAAPQGPGSNAAPAAGSSTGSEASGLGTSCAAGREPLRWVGYEMSPYSVAKSLVLLQMIEQGAAVDEVLQVWYSAAWSKATLKAFRKAITSLLTAAAKRQPHPSAAALCHPVVLELLRHWQVKDVKLAAARRSWQDTAASAPVAVANFKRRQDRMALCQLALTGELPQLVATW